MDMIIEFIFLNGYGMYVWPAFIFTFLSCFYLYFKTKKELQQQEGFYLNKFKRLQDIEIEVVKKKESTRKVLSGSSI